MIMYVCPIANSFIWKYNTWQLGDLYRQKDALPLSSMNIIRHKDYFFLFLFCLYKYLYKYISYIIYIITRCKK